MVQATKRALTAARLPRARPDLPLISPAQIEQLLMRGNFDGHADAMAVLVDLRRRKRPRGGVRRSRPQRVRSQRRPRPMPRPHGLSRAWRRECARRRAREQKRESES